MREIEYDAGVFYEAVRQMRDAQKRYFKTRDCKALQESKSLEALVDVMVEDYYKENR